MATPDTRHSIVISKTMPYRGGQRTFSNRYHFEGDLPPTETAWETMADAIVADEAGLFSTGVTVVEAAGYDSGSASPTNPHGDSVFRKSYTTAGTLTPGAGSDRAPGDAAALVRYSTPARSSKNHPVYLFNYYHDVFNESGQADNVDSTQSAALLAYANGWISGYSDGSETHERCGPRGAVATSARVDPFIRHRDFPN